MIEQLFTIPETAKVLRVKSGTIRKWIYGGQLPSVKLGGRVCLKTQDIRDFIANNYHVAAVKKED